MKKNSNRQKCLPRPVVLRLAGYFSEHENKGKSYKDNQIGKHRRVHNESSSALLVNFNTKPISKNVTLFYDGLNGQQCGQSPRIWGDRQNKKGVFPSEISKTNFLIRDNTCFSFIGYSALC